MTLHQIVYISRFRHRPTEEELTALLEQSRAKNKALDITGILLYADGRVVQVLEGEELVVHELYATICRDPRHHQVAKLVDIPITSRQFPAWTMGFVVARPADYEQITGYINPVSPDEPLRQVQQASPTLMQLLLNFVALHPVLA
jgi:hypothetical protein